MCLLMMGELVVRATLMRPVRFRWKANSWIRLLMSMVLLIRVESTCGADMVMLMF